MVQAIQEFSTQNKPEQVVPGTFLIKNGILSYEKKQLIDLYSSLKTELYQPTLKSGHYMNIKMTCLGWHWNPIDNQYNRRRTDYDNNVAKHIPAIIKEIARRYSETCFPYHNADWDVCICNYYSPATSLGQHRDIAESHEALDIGHPIVSLSVGSPCTFRIGGFTRDGTHVDVLLEDGDILLMGNESRMRYHGVPLIKKIENPPFYDILKGGRFNLTLRKK